MRIRTIVVGVAAMGVVLAGLVGASATGMLQSKPVSIGLIDIQEVFTNLKERTRIDADLQSEADALKQEASDKQKEAENLKMDLQMLTVGTPEYQSKQEELQSRAIELQAWAAFQQQKLNRLRLVRYQKLYEKIIDEAEVLAKERGIDIMMRKEEAIQVQADRENNTARINFGRVMWHSDGLDVSDELLTRMNNKFTNNMP